MELEQARYGEVEKRSEELAKIRHDFNNQLASIIQLVRTGEDGAAQEMISALTNEINGEPNT
jgi:sensor histidine kinase regulating citrate/malate metabolism